MMGSLFGWANVTAFTVAGQSIKWSDLFGNVFALATVGFALRRSLWTWPVQIAGCVLLFGATMGAHLAGSAARQVALAIAAVYGWYRWSAVSRRESEVEVRWAGWFERLALVAALGLGTVAFALYLKAHPGLSWNPWPDAYIFIGSLVATAAQAKGYIEFWFVWIAVDIVGVPLNFTSGLPVSGLVYGVFFIMVLAGVRQWILKARADGAPRTVTVPAGRSGVDLTGSVTA